MPYRRHRASVPRLGQARPARALGWTGAARCGAESSFGSLPFVLFWCVGRTEGKHTLAEQVLGVEAEASVGAVGEPALERQPDGAESDVLPGNARLLEQLD